MLKIYTQLNDESNLLRSCDAVFNVVYENEWLDDPRVIELINIIDKTEVVTNNILKSDFLGTFPPEKLSGGCKGLILMLKCDEPFIYSSAIFGDNCLKYIFDISKEKDIDMLLCSYLFLESYKNMPIQAIATDKEQYLNTYDDYFSNVLDVAARWWGNDKD